MEALLKQKIQSFCFHPETKDGVYQLLRHLLDLGDEVGEELGHVLLLAGVQRLLVHSVGLTEGPGVVRLPLALLNRRTETFFFPFCLVTFGRLH